MDKRQQPRVRSISSFFRSLAAAGLGIALVGSLAGCGAEKQEPVAPPTTEGAAPGGVSMDEYQKHMQQNAQQRGAGGSTPTATPASGGN